jgi:hypothetical protein
VWAEYLPCTSPGNGHRRERGVLQAVVYEAVMSSNNSIRRAPDECQHAGACTTEACAKGRSLLGRSLLSQSTDRAARAMECFFSNVVSFSLVAF